MFLRIFLLIIVIFYSAKVKADSYDSVFLSNDFNITSLMNAVKQDDDKATNVFLKSGANVNEKNLAGVSALHLAAKYDSIKSMDILIKYGANVNSVDDDKWTPLMRACLNRNFKSVEILLNNKANIWLKNIFDETALVHSVMSNCVECLELIVNNAIKNNYSNTDYIINEINKGLNIVYKREDKKMEEILNDFYTNLTTSDIVIQKKEFDKNKKSNKKIKYNSVNKQDDDINRMKEEIKYIINKIYVFQGEVRFENKKGIKIKNKN